jgi:hypothetical protein
MSETPQNVEDIQKQALLIVGNALRSSSLVGTANLQHVQLGFIHWLEGLETIPRGTPLDATPFYEFLKGQGISVDSANEVILMLRSMEDRLGFFIALPADVEKLSETKKQVILDKYQKRTRGPTYVQQPSHAPGASTQAPPPAGGEFRKRKQAPRGTGLAIFGFIAIGGTLLARFLEEPPPPVVTLSVSMPPEAFSCREVTHVQKVVMCKMPTSEWERIPKGEIERRLEATSRFFADKGFSNVLVMTSEDNQTRCGK